MLLDKIKENFLFAVIRGKSSMDAIKVAEMCIEGGIKNIEITYTTPEASQVIRDLVEKYKGTSDIIIGAGTVFSNDQAHSAIDSGAKFLVSPHFSIKINELCKKENILYFPGCMTPTEVISGFEEGVKLFKIFPGGIVGPRFIRDIHGPFPKLNLMPSGGVSIDNILEWKKVGACAVGIGGSLTEKIDSEGYDSVKRIAEEFVKKIEEEE